MTILLSDFRVAAVPLHECGEPLVRLDAGFGPARALVRTGVEDRLSIARLLLPDGVHLRVVEGHRRIEDQQRIIDRYTREVLAEHGDLPAAELHRLVSRFVSPLAVAPHVAGAAVDLTLVDDDGVELDLGTPIDATPEQSGGRCFTDSPDISREARRHRSLLAAALVPAGLVNYPTEWWHWSFGDRYWALISGAPAAHYGAVAQAVAA